MAILPKTCGGRELRCCPILCEAVTRESLETHAGRFAGAAADAGPFAYSQAWTNCRALGTIRVAEST